MSDALGDIAPGRCRTLRAPGSWTPNCQGALPCPPRRSRRWSSGLCEVRRSLFGERAVDGGSAARLRSCDLRDTMNGGRPGWRRIRTVAPGRGAGRQCVLDLYDERRPAAAGGISERRRGDQALEACAGGAAPVETGPWSRLGRNDRAPACRCPSPGCSRRHRRRRTWARRPARFAFRVGLFCPRRLEGRRADATPATGAKPSWSAWRWGDVSRWDPARHARSAVHAAFNRRPNRRGPLTAMAADCRLGERCCGRSRCLRNGVQGDSRQATTRWRCSAAVGLEDLAAGRRCIPVCWTRPDERCRRPPRASGSRPFSRRAPPNWTPREYLPWPWPATWSPLAIWLDDRGAHFRRCDQAMNRNLSGGARGRRPGRYDPRRLGCRADQAAFTASPSTNGWRRDNPAAADRRPRPQRRLPGKPWNTEPRSTGCCGRRRDHWPRQPASIPA